MAADPETQRWWALTDAMQEPYPERAAGHLVARPARDLPHGLSVGGSAAAGPAARRLRAGRSTRSPRPGTAPRSPAPGRARPPGRAAAPVRPGSPARSRRSRARTGRRPAPRSARCRPGGASRRRRATDARSRRSSPRRRSPRSTGGRSPKPDVNSATTPDGKRRMPVNRTSTPVGPTAWIAATSTGSSPASSRAALTQ